MHYDGKSDRIDLLSEVEVRILKPDPKKGTQVTRIDSDRASIDRKKNLVRFSMLESRPEELRFVRITEPGLTSRSRRAEFRINARKRKLRSIRAIDDVRIDEKPSIAEGGTPAERRRAREEKPRYATAGLAEFDSRRNLIVLREYPQVYQDRDTITGETIIVHRDSDLVEVDQSNAFTEGESSDD